MSKGTEVSECEVAKLGMGELRGMRVECHKGSQGEWKVKERTAYI